MSDIPTVSGPDYPMGEGHADLPIIKGYRITKQIGEGGMGIVYLAEQTEPIKRQVALKIIKPGMDSRQVISRFEAERQALALLDHPNVARVYDAGTTEKGRPYFVMEYIHGIPITDFCDQQELIIEKRLELFRQVCEGVQHAHQRGIIHRDIKPSNILVVSENGKAIPKVIDFGIAKAIKQELTEHSLFTTQGQLIGTPEYMSPEQADLTSLNIDTRTDVYSLGVVLYQLLTGILPFDPKTLRSAAFNEIQRIIKEVDPPRPSVKLSSLGVEAQEIAKTRKTVLATLTKRLHNELEWIPLKAMRKESEYRYQSVSELEMDIENYLNNSPLMAGPESRRYRIKKYFRRNRVLVTSAASIMMVLIIGIIVSTFFAVKADKQRLIAKQNEAVADQAKIVAEQKQIEVEKALDYNRRLNYINNIDLASSKYKSDKFSLLDKYLNACDEDLRDWEWYHLRHISDESYKTFSDFRHSIRALTISPDGNYIACGGFTKIIVWNTTNGNSNLLEAPYIQGHDVPNVLSLAYSPNGQFLVSGHSRGIINIWDTENYSIILTINADIGSHGVTSLSFSPDGKFIVSGAGNGSYSGNEHVKIWEVATGDKVMGFSAKSSAKCVMFNHDGNFVVSGGFGYSNSRIYLWDIDTGNQIMTLNDSATSIDFSSDGEFLLSSDGSNVKIWNIKKKMTAKKIRIGGHVYSVRFSPDNKKAVIGCSDNKVRVWNLQNDEIKSFIGHRGIVESAVFSKNSDHIISGSRDGTVKVWNDFTKLNRSKKRVFLKNTTITSLITGKGRNHIIIGCSDGTIRIWDIETESETLRTSASKIPAISLAYNPNINLIIAGYYDGTIRIFNSENGILLKTLNAHEWEVNSIAINPTGDFCISSSGNSNGSSCILWDIKNWRKIKSYPVMGEGFKSLAFSPDGNSILAGGFVTYLFDVKNLSDLRIELPGYGWMFIDQNHLLLGGGLYRLDSEAIRSAFADDSYIVASTRERVYSNDPCAITHSEEGVLKGMGIIDFPVIEYHDSKAPHKLIRGFGDIGRPLSLSPNTKRLLSLRGDKIIIWNIDLGQELLSLQSGHIHSAFFSPSGRYICAGGSEGLQVWDSGYVNDDNP